MSFDPEHHKMQQAAEEVRLSEDEIRERAASLRRTPTTAQRAGATVYSGLLGLISKLLNLLRIPLFLVYGVVTFMLTQESLGWVLGIGAGLAGAIVLSIITTIIARQAELYSIKRRVI